jgi:hypothetical protein
MNVCESGLSNCDVEKGDEHRTYPEPLCVDGLRLHARNLQRPARSRGGAAHQRCIITHAKFEAVERTRSHLARYTVRSRIIS